MDAPGKRKNLMDNIKSRVNSGAYNMTRYRKNEKNLRNKVKFFEKKEAAGELKGYMRSRLDVARELLARIQAMKSGEAPAAVAVPAPREPTPAVEAREFIPQYLPNNLGPAPRYLNVGADAGPLTIPLNTVKPKKTRGRTAKKSRNNNAELNREIAKMNAQIQREERAKQKANEKEAAAAARAAEREAKEAQRAAAAAAREAAKAARAETKKVRIANVEAPAKTRKHRGRNVIENDYLVQAVSEFLPFPELWDPTTGRKFEPEEDPMPPIEASYKMLRKIREKTWNRADELRAAAAKGSVER